MEILTPLNAKQNAGQNANMGLGASTPNHFMSGVEVAARGHQQATQMQ